MAVRFDNPRAFAPFYDTSVAISGHRAAGREVWQAALACVFENGMYDPISDASPDSDRRSFTVLLRNEDWLDETPPQRGETVMLSDHIKANVKSVARELDGGWRLECREVRP